MFVDSVNFFGLSRSTEDAEDHFCEVPRIDSVANLNLLFATLLCLPVSALWDEHVEFDQCFYEWCAEGWVVHLSGGNNDCFARKISLHAAWGTHNDGIGTRDFERLENVFISFASNEECGVLSFDVENEYVYHMELEIELKCRPSLRHT